MQGLLDKAVAALVSGIVAFLLALVSSQIGGFVGKKEIFFINLGTALDSVDAVGPLVARSSLTEPAMAKLNNVAIDRRNFQSGLVLINSGVDILHPFAINVRFDDDIRIDSFRVRLPDSFLDSDIKVDYDPVRRPGLLRIHLKKLQGYERISIFPVSDRGINAISVVSNSNEIAVSAAKISRLDKSPFYINVILTFGIFIGLITTSIFYVLQRKISVSLSLK